MARCILAGLLGLTVTCASVGCYVPAQRYDNSYTVFVDPTFTDSERGLILAAVEDWTVKTNGGVAFTVVWDRADARATEQGEIAIVPRKQTEMDVSSGESSTGLCTREPYDYSNIRIAIDGDNDPSTHPDWFQHSVTHELGHAMGLHHAAQGTLMYYATKGASLSVTCSDVTEWRRLRGSASASTSTNAKSCVE